MVCDVQDKQTFDFYNEYVKVKRDQLLTMMDDLLHDMQVSSCNVRHFRNWETRLSEFKNEYRIFHKNILQRINDESDEMTVAELEQKFGSCCEQLEDHYEILAQVFLTKRNEIERKTTYFEVKRGSSLPRFWFSTNEFIKKQRKTLSQLIFKK